MSNKNERQQVLDPPPIAHTDPGAVEVLRVWAAPGSPQQLVLRTTWKDAGAWGLVLVDIAQHAAKAYASEGRDPKVILARIRELFDKEWENPTDDPKELSSH